MRMATLIAGAAALYSIVALGCWGFVNSPFAGIAQMPGVLVTLIPVLLPYALIAAADHLSVDPFSRWTAILVSIAAAFIASLLYWPSFSPNDGEYGVVFLLVPIVQVVPAGPLAGIVFWRRRRFSRAHS